MSDLRIINIPNCTVGYFGDGLVKDELTIRKKFEIADYTCNLFYFRKQKILRVMMEKVKGKQKYAAWCDVTRDFVDDISGVPCYVIADLKAKIYVLFKPPSSE